MNEDIQTITSWFSYIGIKPFMIPFILVFIATIFQIFAWYSHVTLPESYSIMQIIMLSWAIAFFEFVFLIPAINMADKQGIDLAFFTVFKEASFFILFALFNWLVLGNQITMKQILAYCLMGFAVYLIK